MEYKRRNPLVAGFLSFIEPGLGQFYNGELVKAFLFLITPFLVLSFYFFNILMTKPWAFYLIFMISLLFRFGSAIEAFISASGKQEYQLKKYNSITVYLLVLIVWGISSNYLIEDLKDYSQFRSFKIPSANMKNTLLVGDFLIADTKYFQKNEIKRNDVVIFYPPNDPKTPWINRIVALENDTVQIKQGRLFINGKLTNQLETITRERSLVFDSTFTDPNIFMGKGNIDNFGPYQIPENNVFLLGDNRDNSFDSRYFGFVNKDQVFGKPLYIWISFDQTMPRFDRFLKSIE